MKNEKEKIECPLCKWEPDGKPYWVCSKCETQWNTFSTGGVCPSPSCMHKHKDTQCISCQKHSPHIDWYKGLDKSLEQLLKEVESIEIKIIQK